MTGQPPDPCCSVPRLPRLQLEQAARYQVCVQGQVQADWSDWLSEAEVRVRPGEGAFPAVTCLTGTVADQSALFGLLAYIRDRRLVLVNVVCLGPAPA